MSFVPTSFRPVARGGWGGRAASHFRGLLSLGGVDAELPMEDPQTFGLQWRGQIGSAFIRHYAPTVNPSITGVTRDSTGAILGTCRVELFRTGGDIPTATTISDASGNFSFTNPGSGPFYLVAYKVGSPDVAGTTVNTLIAV